MVIKFGETCVLSFISYVAVPTAARCRVGITHQNLPNLLNITWIFPVWSSVFFNVVVHSGRWTVDGGGMKVQNATYLYTTDGQTDTHTLIVGAYIHQYTTHTHIPTKYSHLSQPWSSACFFSFLLKLTWAVSFLPDSQP
ncbi:hypothetical protein F4775DRAFT_490560 [Biscogniauxia sp. FL1348]|nr:hypothetical protein F4775DRAFT_490560 [Biscogniauxia sp. FL1348]